eukprot:CAMPEP_0115432942 /NCGR_PEP_ID=MMETSP0271-20121206/32375_1 /TAXON_ID=71861 /ORGANISM="Scrippsiella trochoidea, Strain CCMP3099" /LENGTH=39 /DNA_ID= /DNA_START= /DNA_END= /DNA_ORIENTATION=
MALEEEDVGLLSLHPLVKLADDPRRDPARHREIHVELRG